MSMVVTISNEANLRKIKQFLGARDENEAVELALEKIVGEFEQKEEIAEKEVIDIDVHSLNRILPKRTCQVKAKVRFGGRGEPLKYDLSDYTFDEYDED